MSIVTVRVSRDLKRRMKMYKDVNWSEVIRRALEERISLEEKIRGRSKASVREASLIIDQIYEKVLEEYGTIKYDSSETIRLWRDLRYSSQTHQ